MDEWRRLLVYVVIGGSLTLCIMIISWYLAKRKGRDTVGWFLAPIFFAANVMIVMIVLSFVLPDRVGWSFIGLSGAFVAILTPLVLSLLAGIETQGFRRRCPGCARVIPWNDTVCRKCGKELEMPKADPNIKVKCPLRTFFLYESLFVLLLLIVFGFIGYYCVPNQPQVHGSLGMGIC